MPHKPGIGAILGIVSEDGVAKQNYPIRLYDRTSGALVAYQQSDVNGGFVFNGLNPETDDYQVVTQDETGPPYKNAMIKDRIQPIYAHQGAAYWANWRYLAMNQGALCLFDGSAQDERFMPCGFSSSRPMLVADNETIMEAPFPVGAINTGATPGAPQAPMVELGGNRLLIKPRTNGWAPSAAKTRMRQNPAECAFEFVADFATLSQNGAGAGAVDFYVYLFPDVTNGRSNGSNYFSCLLFVRYDPAGKTLRVWYSNGGNGQYSKNPVTELTASPYIDMSAYQGVHHVLVTISYAVLAEIFIDGVSKQSFDLTGKNSVVGYGTAYHFCGIAVMDSGNTHWNPYAFNGAHGKLGPLAFYPHALTATEASDLHGALMIGSTPLLTGYSRDVFIDTPVFYARLNETTGTAVANFLRQEDIWNGYTAGNVAWSQPTPVAGGIGAKFTGAEAIRFDSEGSKTDNPWGYTLEFWYQPANAAPAAMETLYAITDTAENRVGPQLQRDTTGVFVLTHAAVSAETITFATLMNDTANVHHVIVEIDKHALEARLYIDGVLTETRTCSAIVLDLHEDDVLYSGQVHIGGIMSDLKVVSEGFSGVLSEVAQYNYALPEGRIEAHYTARNTV